MVFHYPEDVTRQQRSGGDARDVVGRVSDVEVSVAELRTDVRGVQRTLRDVAGTITKLGDKLDRASRPADVRWVVAVILFLAGTAVTLSQCSMQKAVHDAEMAGRNAEAFRQLERRTVGWERNHKDARLADKELHAQALQSMRESVEAVERRVTNGPMTAVRARVKNNEDALKEIQTRLTVNGCTKVMHDALAAHVLRLERDLADHEQGAGHQTMVERMKALQTVVGLLREDLATVRAMASANADEDYKRPEADADLAKIEERLRVLEMSAAEK